MHALALTCGVAIGLVFLTSAVTKVRDFDGFREALQSLAPSPGLAKARIAYTVVAMEFAIPATLAAPVEAIALLGFGMAALLLGAFTVAIAIGLRRGVAAPCHCFGAASQRRLGRSDLIRDVVLVAFAAAGLVTSASTGSAPASTGSASSSAALVLSGAAGAIGALLVLVADEVIELFVPPQAR